MSIHGLGLVVLLSAATVSSAASAAKKEKSLATPYTKKELTDFYLLDALQQFALDRNLMRGDDFVLPRPVQLRGILVKVPDPGSVSPRTGKVTRFEWHLAAPLPTGEIRHTLQIADKKLLESAEQHAGKEVTVTGNTVVIWRLGRRFESASEFVPYIGVGVQSLK